MSRHILRQHVGYWINKLRQRVHLRFEERLSAYDISIAAWCVLVSVYDDSARSINELSRYIEVDKASVSRLVDKLEKRGLLTHKEGGDKRSGVVALTKSGRELVPLLIEEAEENERQFFAMLSKEQMSSFKKIINLILHEKE
ncbi:MarR family winged helix-turn-helix transcriptional regulator [Estrella lausannensis]|uniref:Transcriptional regulator, MarR family n=1 Tax=Estrella lausannensis TaxID=483423 RepID=A0A0H5DPR4_9BACT|nr:MarR family transcriptional regulator [Estrella lausannensis]CRX38008.1 Transcriptional regulator, MarR family [Estrella lausannensis]